MTIDTSVDVLHLKELTLTNPQLAEQSKGVGISLSQHAVVVCQRGAKVAVSKAVELDQDGADWANEKLSMIATLYRIEGKGFREKIAKFVLRGVRTSPASNDNRNGDGIPLASGSIDLAHGLGADIETKRQVALELKSKIAGQKKANFGTLHLTISCTWLTDAR